MRIVAEYIAPKNMANITLCHQCDRGGNGNAKDKCACGWKQSKPSALGCYIGTPIVGEPRKHDKVSRSKARYLHYLDVADCFESFRDFLMADTDARRQVAI